MFVEFVERASFKIHNFALIFFITLVNMHIHATNAENNSIERLECANILNTSIWKRKCQHATCARKHLCVVKIYRVILNLTSVREITLVIFVIKNSSQKLLLEFTCKLICQNENSEFYKFLYFTGEFIKLKIQHAAIIATKTFYVWIV